jgi:hypothetical protein
MKILAFEGTSEEYAKVRNLFSGEGPGVTLSDRALAAAEATYSVGDRVIGEWEDIWYPGAVIEARDGEYRIRFDDGDEAWLTADELRPGKAKRRELKLETLVRALKRLPLSGSQQKVFEILAEADEPGLTNEEIANKAGLSRQELAGVLGALGRRFANTDGWPRGVSPFGTKWDDQLRQYRYWGTPRR